MAMTGSADDASSVSGLVLAEARELRRKQDARLRGLQGLSRSMLAGFLSAGLIALASRPHDVEISDTFSLAIAYSALVLVGVTVLVEFSTSRWSEGPNIEALINQSRDAADSADFEKSLAQLHDVHRWRNERSLVKAKRFVALQVSGTLGGGALLLFLLLD